MKKSATQARKQTLDRDPANITVEAEDISGVVGADHGHDLAQLVWKYFGEEITDIGTGGFERLKPEGKSAKTAVTNQERKEVVRCVIDHVVVAATKARVDATIFWKSGSQTPLSIWRGAGRYNLIRELYAEKLTVLEIKERLAARTTSTGLTAGRLYMILHKLGLRPNRFSAAYLLLGQKAADLHREGRSLEWIARHFNEQGFASASGKSWTRNMVFGLHREVGGKTELLENIHRSAMADALRRGLSYREIASEFNEKKIRRRGRQLWTERNINKRWFDLTRLQRTRAQKGLTSTEPSVPIVLPRSA